MDPVTAFAMVFLPVATVLVMAMPLRAAIREAESERRRAKSAEAVAHNMGRLAAESAAALEDLRASLSRSEGDPYRSGPPKDLDVTTGKLTALEALAAYQRWVAVNRAIGVNCCMERGTAHDFFSRIARLPSGLDSATVGGDGEIH